jgi:hypothetical protein
MSKLHYSEIKAKAKEFLALTSLTPDEFELLVPPFEKAFQEHMSHWCVDGQPRNKRSYTTYVNCPLPAAEERLLFVLSYVKGNPLQSNHGVLFGMGQGKTNQWLHTLLPVLRATFRHLELAPARSVSELALRLAVTLPGESEALPAPAATSEWRPIDPPVQPSASEATPAPALPPPLFAMMAQNGRLSAPKIRLHRQPAIAARKGRIP